MNVLFIVQGEGRGHLTQAISLYRLLTSNSHTVSAILVGHAVGKSTPDFFGEKFSSEIIGFESPHLVFSKKTKALHLGKTAQSIFCYFSRYLKSIKTIKTMVERHQPDIIINFYDGLGGIFNRFYNTKKIPMMGVAHQYLFLKKEFKHPPYQFFNRLIVNTNSRITTLGNAKKVALSFTPFNHESNISVVPPLIRKEELLLDSENQKFILVYVTQSSLAKEVELWHEKHQNVEIHCFWDNKTVADEYSPHPNLTFHHINSSKFLKMMKVCRGLVTTAGFESVCEAMYLQKPVMMVPIPNHYEQLCNAFDGVRAMAGIYQKSFDISPFLDYLEKKEPSLAFQEWANQTTDCFLQEINKCVSLKVQ
jgi:uncharacterized protein (TIGR00661 family)